MRHRTHLMLAAFALGSTLLPTACGSSEAPAAPARFVPSVVPRAPTDATARGLLDRRGLIHAHSVYSHDACDDVPRDPQTDDIDLDCLDDFRRGLCQTGQDYVMLTDHNESFARSEYPDVLLFDASRGDQLIERAGAPVANWLACPDAPPVLVLAGTETKTMPVGLERHVAPTPSERSAVYGSLEPAELAKLHAAGAVVLLQHTEDWSVDQLLDLPIDGFEMYNLHANTISGLAGALSLIGKITQPELLPFSDLVLLPIVNEDARYLERWGTVLARGAKRVTTMGTDCHRNTFPAELPDGERIDSYRRMMIWFSNHLLVTPDSQGGFDDRALKDALRAGRLYGSFDVLGYPQGFDFHARTAGGTHEMGAELVLADAPELVVTAATIAGLTSADRQPDRTTRLLRAREGGWDVVAEAALDLTFPVTEPGAYRVELRMRPRHLARWLSSFSELSEGDFVWIYSNAIYVR
ncbi:MAG: hypothetical protein KF718_07900 [Polyangiaceae bacterium]|nr:hypothetical protein [Polyangiaceae bacterium]